MSYSLPKAPRKCDSAHADLIWLQHLSSPLGVVTRCRGLHARTGGGKEKAAGCGVFPHLWNPFPAWHPGLGKSPSKPKPRACSSTSATYSQLIRCKGPLGLANSEGKVAVNVNYWPLPSPSSLCQALPRAGAARGGGRAGFSLGWLHGELGLLPPFPMGR